MSDRKIFLALPTYDGSRHNGVALMSVQNKVAWSIEIQSSSLTYGFNRLWAEMLNRRADGCTHFVMIHADIRPMVANWLDVLVKEQEEAEADILSVIVPIKTGHGLTSTGVETDDIWHPRRVSMREVHQLPETWTADGLILNTGLWIAKIGDWAEKITFTMNDKIERGADGKWRATFEPEDWNFSRQARALGLSLYATRKIPLKHVGTFQYGNETAWGVVDRDPGDPK